MQDHDEITITDAVIGQLAKATSPRVRQVSEALVRHLHDLIREIEPTTGEWMAALDFLTRTGHLCSPSRQEFILLSDVLGTSTLVDAINHRRSQGATDNTVLGPFYVDDPPEHPLGADLSAGAIGEPLDVTGTVHSADGGRPLADAVVDTWQADGDGYYDVQYGGEPSLRARLRTDVQGRFWFRSVVPSSYPIPGDGTVGEMLAAQGRHRYRPAHLHFRITSPDHQELVTHVFPAGDRYLDSDVVFGVKHSLIRSLVRHEGHAHLHQDFVLAPRDTKPVAEETR